MAGPADVNGSKQAAPAKGGDPKVFTTDPPTRAVAKLDVELPNTLVSLMTTAHPDV